MKPKPSSSIERAIRSGGCSSEKPSASSTSAEPEADETARLPCFATAAPAAAATSAAAVEMLNVLRAVAAGAGGVDEVVALRADGQDVLAHRLRAAGDLVGRLALQPQRDEEAADLGRRRLAAHDLVHHLARLARARGRGLEQLRERVAGSSLEEVPARARGPSGA